VRVSVIIVNYRVRFFLEQCLCSVQKASRGLDAEIFVVDNHSGDQSLAYLIPKFPSVRFIANEVNQGFARACNQALALASGQYLLFLNPDTILPEDFLSGITAFMDAHPQAGAAGVGMVDGTGQFLPESARGFPSPWAAFCKLSGLTSLFPHSRLFARYYMGHLSWGETHPVDVLSGACMMVRKQTMDLTGGFDERFFMYAEDIDLSYRIQQAGYLNYYVASQRIIHFKGESTRKDFRYVKLFYRAMSQFVRKHFRRDVSLVFTLLMDIAIWFRSLLALAGHWFSRPHRPKADIRTFLAGDPGGKKEAEALLSSTGRTLVTRQDRATEIVWCEGKELSFGEIIGQYAQNRAQLPYKIHALGSASIVGSDSKNTQGDTIPNGGAA
jgi:GT2 family glycosyltransferase